jgi:hypothetical protein
VAALSTFAWGSGSGCACCVTGTGCCWMGAATAMGSSALGERQQENSPMSPTAYRALLEFRARSHTPMMVEITPKNQSAVNYLTCACMGVLAECLCGPRRIDPQPAMKVKV